MTTIKNQIVFFYFFCFYAFNFAYTVVKLFTRIILYKYIDVTLCFKYWWVIICHKTVMES